MKKTYGWMGSIALHLLIAFLLLAPSVVKKPPNNGKPIPVKFFMREDKLRGEELVVGKGLACAGYHYTGVGIRMSYDIIIEVAPNSPAESAGLREGDELIDPNQLAADRFAIGTAIDLKIKRNGREIVVPIKIGNICNE